MGREREREREGGGGQGEIRRPFLTTAQPIRSATIESEVTKMVAPPAPINTVDPYRNTSATTLPSGGL